MKLWGGRFTKGTDKVVEDFHSSISFDRRLYRQDIKGSIAHARMLGKQGIITPDEAAAITAGLEAILADIEAGKTGFETGAEDIHMNIEKLLTERIGDIGRKLHTARSRNDQIALDIRMYLKEEIKETSALLVSLEETLLNISELHTGTVMPGYTHLQRAQPVTFGHHLMAYFEMFKRDIERLADCHKRADLMPLGSGALAGTTFELDRSAVADELGFSGITGNSLDSVGDRDFAIEFCAAASIIMMHLSRFCEEIILWSSAEFQFIELDDAYSTGSSIMPQKKNPDVAELIRGKTGRVYGDLIALLIVMKSLPLAYNKDMQEDKEALFDAIDTVKGCLQVFIPMIETLRVCKDNMAKAAQGGFINATEVADYLARKGVPFRKAHEIVGKLVLGCIKMGKSLNELKIEEYKQASPVIEKDIYDAIDIVKCIQSRSLPGGPAPSAVADAVNRGKLWLSQLKTVL
ncbi:MAG: argininosuccinate lyase [Firmicutes bacterium HGW-Firmicutes-8]|nr:MAG: argininosuccinate lyase [Firmicutes bacterium HGW-Firmicutes-8]